MINREVLHTGGALARRVAASMTLVMGGGGAVAAEMATGLGGNLASDKDFLSNPVSRKAGLLLATCCKDDAAAMGTLSSNGMGDELDEGTGTPLAATRNLAAPTLPAALLLFPSLVAVVVDDDGGVVVVAGVGFKRAVAHGLLVIFFLLCKEHYHQKAQSQPRQSTWAFKSIKWIWSCSSSLPKVRNSVDSSVFVCLLDSANISLSKVTTLRS